MTKQDWKDHGIAAAFGIVAGVALLACTASVMSGAVLGFQAGGIMGAIGGGF